jgi:5-formyltetrahydrofolate cyclo-ligase
LDEATAERAIEQEKHALRSTIRQRLAELDAVARRASGERLVARLTALPVWCHARSVLLFAPMSSEPDVDQLWHGDHLENKMGVYPAVSGQGLLLFRVHKLEDLRRVPPWNLRQPVPDPDKQVAIGAVDLILVPGLAFDMRGGRLGRGGGFYDRLLETRDPKRTVALGVCFEFQRVEHLPLAPHDALLDGVVSC